MGIVRTLGLRRTRSWGANSCGKKGVNVKKEVGGGGVLTGGGCKKVLRNLRRRAESIEGFDERSQKGRQKKEVKENRGKK